MVNYEREKDKFVTSFVFVPPRLLVTAEGSRDGTAQPTAPDVPPKNGEGAGAAGVSQLRGCCCLPSPQRSLNKGRKIQSKGRASLKSSPRCSRSLVQSSDLFLLNVQRAELRQPGLQLQHPAEPLLPILGLPEVTQVTQVHPSPILLKLRNSIFSRLSTPLFTPIPGSFLKKRGEKKIPFQCKRRGWVWEWQVKVLTNLPSASCAN